MRYMNQILLGISTYIRRVIDVDFVLVEIKCYKNSIFVQSSYRLCFRSVVKEGT